MVDAVTLRQVLIAFLPAGGVIERLGDNREKTREKARETLVILGGLAFRSGGSVSSKSKDGKGPETPLMIFERFLKEGGLGSKVWRTREQVCGFLLHYHMKSHRCLEIAGHSSACSHPAHIPFLSYSPISSTTSVCS
jgi:CLIP-associating protein 1/2